jgi:hypothetical protein
MSDGRKLRPVVYISGPVTKGNRNWNVYQGFEAQRELTDAGFAPINPIASTTYPFAWEEGFPHGVWMEVDLALVARADAVLRLPGDSKGADEECMFADLRGIPVYGSVADLKRGFRARTSAAAASKRRRSLTQGDGLA